MRTGINNYIMCLQEPVINNACQTDNICRILPDDEIRRVVNREIAKMKNPLKSMVLTWEKVLTEYHLEIILVEEAEDDSATPETRRVTVGCVDKCEYNALNKLVMAGRRLYFRLRTDFPMLRRRLSTYRFLHSEVR